MYVQQSHMLTATFKQQTLKIVTIMSNKSQKNEVSASLVSTALPM
jgi:hypothetical protein